MGLDKKIKSSSPKLDRLKKEIKRYDKLILNKPDYAEAYYNRGVLFLVLRQLKKAIEDYDKAIQINPDYADAFNNRGIALQELGQLEKAIEDYDKAIQIKPNNPMAYHNQGIAFRKLGQPKKAIESCNKAIQINPDYTEAFNNRGAALQELGELEKAIEDYDKAVEIKPDYADAYIGRGIALQELGQLEKAIKDYDKAVQINQNYAYAYYNRGLALRELGQLELAIESYERAIQINPNHAEVYVSRGIALQELGQLEQAIESCNKALEIEPSSNTAQHILNSLLGNDVQSVPEEYIKNLFNKYAQNFENHLVNKLGYTSPSFFKTALKSLGLSNKKFNKAIDLGCGTGLVGTEFRNMVDVLVGIDLSEKMIRQAKEKNVYDELIVSDLVDGLKTLKTNFDLFISADVFAYIGDLAPLFDSVKKHANNESLFIFSTEDMSGDGFFLQQTGRFAHSKNYILSTASHFGFKLEHFEQYNLRKNKGKWYVGGIYIFRKIIK